MTTFAQRACLGLLLLFCFHSAPALAQWKADKPIRIIVPWSAGGSTDQTTRVLAAELEKALGQPITVLNQPGASGSIGTQNVLDAPRDGYTFAAGAAKDLGVYKLLGMLDTRIQDWHLYLAVAHVAVVSVNAKLPYRNMGELLKAMRARPGEFHVATAGINSSGHSAMQAIARIAQVQVQQLSYDGGRTAVLATVAGDADVTTQLAADQISYFKAGSLRPLAVVSQFPLQIEGYGQIEPLAKTLSGFSDPPNYFGLFIPKGVPPRMIAALDRVWDEKIARSKDLQDYATKHGAMFAPSRGDMALAQAMPAVRAYAWAQHAAGRTKMSPASLGIPEPQP